MAARKRKAKPVVATNTIARSCCATPPVQTTMQIADKARAAANARHEWLWYNEPLVYSFLTHIDTWRGSEAECNAVRAAFQAWANTGMALRISEATSYSERSHIHIAFDPLDGQGTWSKLGKEAGDIDQYEKTMNFSRTLLDAEGRKLALHEVGHALGFKHEHQNPTRGIVWKSEAAVKAYFLKEKLWDGDLTSDVVIRKFAADDFEGSAWDPDSIMNYEIPAALMQNRTKPVAPTGISAGDIARARRFYAPVDPHAVRVAKPFLTQVLEQRSGEQGAFEIRPDQSRKYTLTTLGELDVSMSLFEQSDEGGEIYMATDKDGGLDTNAEIEARLIAGRRYIVRLRVLYTAAPGQAAFVVY